MIYPQNFEQKIGFDSIRHLLKEKCLSTLGQERVDEMNFSESFKDINEWLEQVMEFMRIIQEEDSFPDQYFFDVRPSLKRIRVCRCTSSSTGFTTKRAIIAMYRHFRAGRDGAAIWICWWRKRQPMRRRATGACSILSGILKN